MSLTMTETSDDLSAVSWVHEELRKTLESAHKALRRFGKEAEAAGGSDIDAVDPAVLRTARAHIHQGVGALELVGLPACAVVLRASETLVQRAASRPQTLTPAVMADIERASFALLDYLGRLLGGKPVSPLSLFPQYRAVQDAAEANRVHPADLWSVDWRWRELPADTSMPSRRPDAALHDALEGELLALMRGAKPQVAAAHISDLCAALGVGATDAEVATLWRLAAGVFQAQAAGLLGFDLYTKRFASRLLAQFRILERGESDASERLARDLLFFCAQSAPPAPGQAPRLAAVREAYALPDDPPVDYSTSVLGRFDPALIVNARKRVASAKEAWSAVAGGEMHRLAGLTEQFSLVGDSLKRLFPHGEAFGGELQGAVAQTQAAGAAPPAPLAMEVATSLLYVEAALDDADFDDPEHAGRVRRLAERLGLVRQNHPPDPLEGWMEELYRRVSDRQTMGSVVQELRSSLSEAEKAIDQFFRNPADHKVLINVPQQLSAMRGVLSVLGMEQAAAALLRMRDEVDGLVSTEIDPLKVVQTGLFDRLAGNLSALGFLIDMLSVQPQLAKSLFVYDADAGTLSPVMGREVDSEHMNIGLPALAPQVEPRLLEQAQLLAFTSVREDVPLVEVTRDLEKLSQEAQAADQPSLAAAILKAQEAFERADDEHGIATARGELSEALVDFVATASEAPALEPQPSVAPRQTPPPATPVDDFQEDDEMRGIFLEEAGEVLRDAGAACQELARSPGDLAVLTTLRRAFHTLKGSSRMVGLKDFGEAAWTCEQLYNTHLAEQRAAEPAFVAFTSWSLGYLGAWIEEIGGRRPIAHDASTVKARAEHTKRQLSSGEISDIALPIDALQTDAPPTKTAPAAPLGLPADLPSASDLDLVDFQPTLPPADALAPAPAPTAAAPAFPPTDDLPLISLAPEARETAAPAAPAGAAAPAAPGVAFELDLSALDAPAGSAQAYSPAQPHLDPNVQALFDPFDAAPSVAPSAAPAAPHRGVDLEVDDLATGPVDLDLGGASSADRFIDTLVPSAHAPLSAVEPAAEGAIEIETPDTSHLEIDLSEAGALDEAMPQPAAAAVEPEDVTRAEEDLVKVVGPLRISIPLFNIYLNEADELSRRLTTELAEWAMELHRPIGETAIALAHSLAGSSATVGYADLSHLARVLEHAQTRAQAIGHGTAEEGKLFLEAAEEIRRLLHQFAAGFLKEASPEILARLAEHEVSSAKRLEAKAAALASLRDSTQGALSVAESAAYDAPDLGLAELDPDAVETTPARLESPPDPDSVETAPAEFELDGLSPPTHPTPRTFEPSSGGAGDSTRAAIAASVAGTAPPPLETSVASPWVEAPSEAPSAPAEPASPFADHGTASASFSHHEPPASAASAPAHAAFAPVEHRDFEDSTHGRSAFGALHGLGQAELKPLAALPAEARPVHVSEGAIDAEEDLDAQDAVDPELFPIFEEEGLELIPQLAGQLRAWVRNPDDNGHAAACMRTLHTLKGGARLAGAMRLGEMAHRLETRIERLLAHSPVSAEDIEALQARCDNLAHTLEALRGREDALAAAADAAALAQAEAASAAESRSPHEAPAGASSSSATPGARDTASSPPETAAREDQPAADSRPATLATDATTAISAAWVSAANDAPPAAASDDVSASTERLQEPVPAAGAPGTGTPIPAVPTPRPELPPIDWSRFARGERRATARPGERVGTGQAAVRVGAPLLDRLVNLAGEVSITRSRVEAGVGQIKSSLGDLTENLERLRGQLRDIEIQGETQMASRLEAAKAAAQTFDPLEFDRFTRFQEITRMMAESVNDVATVQRTLQRSLEATEDELVAQARMTRELQDDLLRTRMVEFEGLSDRLYRVVRQAAKETGKQVRLDIVGGSIEIDRGVLDRMTGAFEHLLRNCVTHGIEAPADRTAAGKEAAGSIVVALSHEGNEVGIEFRDDGAGLDLPRIRAKGLESGLIPPDTAPTDMELANLIFTPGFSTAATVTELAGRGVGMDVVRSEVVAMGGRIETATEAGKGTAFKLILPLTTAVTQVVMLRCAETTVAVPSTLVETVRRATPQEVEAAYASGVYPFGDKQLPFFWLGALLQISTRPGEAVGRTRSVVVVRSAQQRIAVHVDEILGNQEVVVKNLGPQLSRLPGLAGMTLLASGAVALIYNPVALAALYGEDARMATAAALQAPSLAPVKPDARIVDEPLAPLVLVVDDSLTVRRVTQRLLLREGYRVALAKDGLDALERLAEELPAIVLSDIEMPRMDGFDLVRNLRSDPRWRGLPVIMITSRIAQKHKDHATELGVDHYLGKPYSEEDLLALIGRYTRNPTQV
jgi:chemosensory pili system protein ChpA (sensor histidine kinase/response regulator)